MAEVMEKTTLMSMEIARTVMETIALDHEDGWGIGKSYEDELEEPADYPD